MGWAFVTKLDITQTTNTEEPGASLWTRGGVNGIEIHRGADIIHISREVLLELLADDIRTHKIGALEGMEAEEILAQCFAP